MLLSAERQFGGASVVGIAGATLLHLNGLVTAVLPASREHVQTDHWGSPGTWEILSFPRRTPGWRYRVTNSGPWRRTRPSRSEKNEWMLRYCREGNEVRRNGRQEVAAL